jgi:3-methyladenine DNA glycosylase Tag
MGDFAGIYALAAARKGGPEALEGLIAQHRPKSREELAATPDDRWLSQMSRNVFQAGFSWRVIDQKWPGFEAAFEGFDPRRCAMMSDERFDELLKDARIVRNARKIDAVRSNALFLVGLAREHGSAAKLFAEWPDEDFVSLVEMVKSRATGLGAESAMRLFRWMGKPSFITSRDVTAALIREGVLARPPSGRRDFKAVQEAFNGWARESGRDLTAISRTLAMSVGA